MKRKVCILVGGGSTEREVSFLTCEELVKNLKEDKYDVNTIEIEEDENPNWIQSLLNNKPDIILSALHGGIGENGSVQGVLECLKIPYVGSKVFSSSLSMNKKASKEIMKNNGIPVIADVYIERNEKFINFEEKIFELGLPVIIKPNNGGSSVGISIAHSMDEVIKGISDVKKYNDDIIVEKYIKGKEVTCGVVETSEELLVLGVLDIDTSNKFYDYKAKYIDEHTSIEFSYLPEYQKTSIMEIAKKVFQVLDCSGYGRVDMMVDEEQIYVLEMNTLPGLTSHSLIPKAASKMWSFSDFLDMLIQFEMNKGRAQN